MVKRDTAFSGSSPMLPDLILLTVLVMDVAVILILLVIGIVVYLNKRKKPDEGEDNSPPSPVQNVTLEKRER